MRNSLPAPYTVWRPSARLQFATVLLGLAFIVGGAYGIVMMMGILNRLAP